MSEFITIKNSTQTKIEIKKSKFITNIMKISSIEDAKNRIEIIKKQEYKANHHPNAYILGNDSIIKHSSDDGEPSGTSGSPILNAIEENNLTNVLIVVTRYFGGIKLGSGGLIRAYSSAASEAIKKSTLVEMIKVKKISLEIPYNLLETFKYNTNYPLFNISYSDNIKADVNVPYQLESEFIKKLIDRYNNSIKITGTTESLKSLEIKKD